MPSSMYDGFFINGRSYSATQIARKFRLKNKRRALLWLDKLEVPCVEGPNHEELYLGDDINLAIAEHGRCRNENDQTEDAD